LNIRWQGGAIETIELRVPPNRAEELRYPDVFVAHIRALAESPERCLGATQPAGKRSR
jgi:hypothetical protein